MNLNYKDNQFFACYCTLHMADAPDCAGVAKPRTSCPSPADAYWSPGSDDQPWRLNGNTFTTWCGDLDGDGVVDLYNAEIKHWHIGQSAAGSELLHGAHHDGTIAFTRPGNTASGMVGPHLSSDWNEGGLMAAGADLDGDGRKDMILATSDYPEDFGWVYHQKADHSFEEVGAQWGMHHACVVRSPHGAARIKSIDTKAALALPGVAAVFIGADIKHLGPVPCAASLPGLRVPHHHLLAQDRVYYVGHAVAVVVATDKYIARDAVDLIKVDYVVADLAPIQDRLMEAASGGTLAAASARSCTAPAAPPASGRRWWRGPRSSAPPPAA